LLRKGNFSHADILDALSLFHTGYNAMYAQGQAEFLECHLTLTNQTTDTYCLTLNYLPSPTFGMLVADNAEV
jgi:hypothetical protein